MSAHQADRVVFVRGTGRCGSTMLIDQLGLHPDLIPIPLDEVLPEELLDWSAGAVQPGVEHTSDDVIGAACQAYFLAYCRSLTNRRGIFVHKGTLKAHRLDDLLRHWPEAKLVYLVRHPLGVVESLINADIHLFHGRFNYRATVANSLLRWANDLITYTQSRAFGDPRVHQVKYEDLSADPDRALARIQRFVGVEPRPYEPRIRRERYADRFVLDDRERRWIVETTEQLVATLGYRGDELSAPVEMGDDALDRHADRRLQQIPPAIDGAELVRLAVQEARARGYRRIALFGAGYAARLICPRLVDVDPAPVCVLDDNPLLAGSRLGPFRIEPTASAVALGIEAAIPLTFVHQDKLTARWRDLHGERTPILPLWCETPALAESTS